MVTTAESTKGVPRIEGNPAPTLRADHNAFADWVRDNITRRETNTTTRDAITIKWVGMIVQTADTNSAWMCTAIGNPGTWVFMGRASQSVAVTPGTLWQAGTVPAIARSTDNMVFLDGSFTNNQAVSVAAGTGYVIGNIGTVALRPSALRVAVTATTANLGFANLSAASNGDVTWVAPNTATWTTATLTINVTGLYYAMI